MVVHIKSCEPFSSLFSNVFDILAGQVSIDSILEDCDTDPIYKRVYQQFQQWRSTLSPYSNGRLRDEMYLRFRFGISLFLHKLAECDLPDYIQNELIDKIVALLSQDQPRSGLWAIDFLDIFSRSHIFQYSISYQPNSEKKPRQVMNQPRMGYDSHHQLMLTIHKLNSTKLDSVIKFMERRQYVKALYELSSTQTNDHLECLRILLSFKHALRLDIDTKDIHGNTALHLAAKYHNFEGFKLLFQYAADTEQSNQQNQTPLDILTRQSMETPVPMEQSLIDLMKYLPIHEKNEYALYAIAQAKFRWGMLDEAQIDIQSALEINSTDTRLLADLYFLSGSVYMAKAIKLDEALQLITRAHEIYSAEINYPKLLDSSMVIAQLHFLRQDMKSAIINLLIALKIKATSCSGNKFASSMTLPDEKNVGPIFCVTWDGNMEISENYNITGISLILENALVASQISLPSIHNNNTSSGEVDEQHHFTTDACFDSVKKISFEYETTSLQPYRSLAGVTRCFNVATNSWSVEGATFKLITQKHHIELQDCFVPQANKQYRLSFFRISGKLTEFNGDQYVRHIGIEIYEQRGSVEHLMASSEVKLNTSVCDRAAVEKMIQPQADPINQETRSQQELLPLARCIKKHGFLSQNQHSGHDYDIAASLIAEDATTNPCRVL